MLRGRGMAPPDDASQNREEPENTLERRVTSIHSAYTLAATPDACEVDELIVRHFIETLAEVALAVASRKIVEQEQDR